jgi:hypothetical protein
MNFNFGSGGLMLVALAAVWFLVFLPALNGRGKEGRSESLDRSTRRALLNEHVSPRVAASARAARLSKQVFALLSIASGIASIVFVFQGAAVGALIAAGFVAGFVALSRIANARLNRILVSGSNRRNKVSAGLSGSLEKSIEPTEEIEDRRWTPNEAPKQGLLNRVGTLESPTLADVVEIEFPGELDSKELDEILRRRRAI